MRAVWWVRDSADAVDADSADAVDGDSADACGVVDEGFRGCGSADGEAPERASLIRARGPPDGRLKPRLQHHEVRLRGLGRRLPSRGAASSIYGFGRRCHPEGAAAQAVASAGPMAAAEGSCPQSDRSAVVHGIGPLVPHARSFGRAQAPVPEQVPRGRSLRKSAGVTHEHPPTHDSLQPREQLQAVPCTLSPVTRSCRLFSIPCSLFPAVQRRAVTSCPPRTTPTVTGLFRTSPAVSKAMAPETPACGGTPPSPPMRAT
jgi:hypothetical protein